MKTRTVFLLLIIVALASAAGWWVGSRRASPAPHPASDGGRKVAFYQSSMHPWIKSDKPGKCTICGMDLVPVYEGDKGYDTAAGTVSLGSNTINVLNVRTAPVRRAPLQRTLRFAGTIDDNDSRHRVLSAYVDGRVDRLFVNFVGAEVAEGQPLATFYSPILLAAEREYTVLQRQADPAQADLLAAAAQRLRQFGLNDRQIAALADKPLTNIHTELLAPLTGTVTMRGVYEGQYVKEGDKLFEVADFSTMWFVFDAYERDFAWLRLGQKVKVSAVSVPGRVFEAAVAFIDPNLNPMTRSARVRAELPNPVVEMDGQRQRELLHKIFAEATVNVELPATLVLPRSAVLSPGGNPVVYLDRGGGAYEQRPVKLGRVADADWEVLDGVREGDNVVVNGNLLIDAQAQLNRSAQPPGHDHGATPASAPPAQPPADLPLPELTDVQRDAARNFIVVVDALGTALAADDVARFKATAPQLHTAVPALAEALKDAGGWAGFGAEINRVGHLGAAADLKAARKDFTPLSTATVELAKRLRAEDPAFTGLKLFMCPMTEDAYPGAPKRGAWLQLAAPLRNPYFGAEMLDCGTEVK
jgi:Cu(I)/Ag(I) efflux system membrane fusion protein